MYIYTSPPLPAKEKRETLKLQISKFGLDQILERQDPVTHKTVNSRVYGAFLSHHTFPWVLVKLKVGPLPSWAMGRAPTGGRSGQGYLDGGAGCWRPACVYPGPWSLQGEPGKSARSSAWGGVELPTPMCREALWLWWVSDCDWTDKGKKEFIWIRRFWREMLSSLMLEDMEPGQANLTLPE